MLCILCLKPPIDPIYIFGEYGLSLDIKEIISKHFFLRPCAEDSYANTICSYCWSSLDSFEKFYIEVENAHKLFQLSPNHSKATNKSEVPTTMEDDLNEYNFLTAGIKIEVNEDSNDPPLEFNQIDIPVDPLKTKEELDNVCENIKYDSESEIPISELSKQYKEEQGNDNSGAEISSSKGNSGFIKFKNIKPGEDVFHIKDGVWLASCYSEETTDKRISHEEFDKFIKLNFELLCDLCLKPMESFTVLQSHFQKDHNAGKAYVICCDKKFYLRAALVDHILQHKLPNYFTCILCSKVLTGRKTLMEHQKIHNKKLVYQCPGCDKSFHRKINLNRHKDVHVDFSERSVECTQCDKLFASKFSLKQHMYDAHKIGCAKLICEQCGKVCRDPSTFRRHQFEHTNEEKEYFPCEICGTRLATKDGLRRHQKSQHPKDDKKYFCNYCGLQSSTARALHRHVTYMHTVEPRYKCTLCEKAFKRALRLKEHMTTHTGEVLYTCPHCRKTFNSNANMHSHRKKMHRKEWEENRRHPHMGASSNANANTNTNANVNVNASVNATEENNQQ